MQPDHLSTSDPESIEDLESTQERIRQEIEVVLSQPTDPAILEKMNRDREELERLSQKAVSELSGHEALRLITGKQFSYADDPQLFEKWWKSVDPAIQKEINVAAEDFEDLTDYQWKCLKSSGGSVINATKDTLGIKGLYAQFQASMPKITDDVFTTLWIDAAGRRKVLKRGRDRYAVKCFIENYVREVREVLQRTFFIPANRPTSEQKRDRQFSKCSYQGLTSREIARNWNREHPKSKGFVTKATVAKGVERHRKKRMPVMWLLRVWIFQNNFPMLTTRTCPHCTGKGTKHFGNEWIAWHRRRQKKQDWRAVPENDPEPSCPPPEHCEACGGTGIRNLLLEKKP